MGQRHQIYARVPAKFYNQGNPNNLPEETVGIHHQWLYGRTAIQLLGNALEFMSKCDEYGPFRKTRSKGESVMALAALYSCDFTDGYYHRVHTDLDAECIDPRRGDNNDGITVIDCTGEKPTYCFVNIHHLECDEDRRDSIPLFEPLTARTYLDAYYPDMGDKPEIQEECRKLLARVEDFRLISPERLREIFPAMFEKRASA